MPWYAEDENDQSPEAVRFRYYRDIARKNMSDMLTKLVKAGCNDLQVLTYLAENGERKNKS